MRHSPLQDTDGKDENLTVVRSHSPTCSSSSRTESESGISSAASEDIDPPIYVSLKDFQIIKRNMEKFKAARLKALDSDVSSFRSSSEEKSTTEESDGSRRFKRKRKCTVKDSDDNKASDGDISESGSTSSGNSSAGGKRTKIITAERSCVPSYSISCCSRTFSTLQSLFAHLRQVHNVATIPNSRRRCKMCKTFVNDDLIMLHIELCHTISNVRSYKIEFGYTEEVDGESPKMYMELLPDEEAC